MYRSGTYHSACDDDVAFAALGILRNRLFIKFPDLSRASLGEMLSVPQSLLGG